MPVFIVLVGAVILSIAVVGLVVGIGRVLVRRLQLPTDLPPGLRFEPPPPPPRDPGDSTEAKAIASRQERLAAVYREAQSWAQAAEDHTYGPMLLPAGERPDPWPQLIADAERVEKIAKEAETALQRDDLETLEQAVDERAQDLKAVQERITACEKALPGPDNRKLIVLLILLALALAMCWYVFTLAEELPPV